MNSTMEAPRPKVRIGVTGGQEALVDFVPLGTAGDHLKAAGVRLQPGDGLSINSKRGALGTIIERPETVIVVAPDIRNG